MAREPGTLLNVRADDPGKTLEGLLASPFQSQLSADSTLASLIFSLALAAGLALLFGFLRPYNNVVYAPRAKYADAKHAPPPITKGPFAWIKPLLRTKEHDIVERVGLDAAIFMRVTRMLRDIFIIIAILGCAIVIPANLVGSGKQKNINSVSFFLKMTPQYSYGHTGTFWAYVLAAWLFDIIIMGFLWWNYKQVTRLRREYFNSQDYQRSLHARTLLVTDIPQNMRSDEGIARLTDEVKATHDMPRTAIARNVKDLPELVEEHTETVKELEEHLAKYLRNPDRLPAKRPECKPHKKDKAYGSYPKGSKVDAIEYLTGRINELEIEIREVRETVDKRNALSYGFATYDAIPVAHSVAYAARKKAPQGSIVRLAPKPNDLIWKNLQMSKKQRSRQNLVNSIWITLLTVFWVVPNVLIAVFLSNLSNLGKVWPAFQTSLEQNRTWWAIVQGIAAPAITTAFYFYLPAIFRKLCMKAGDTSKTSRERHVARSLYNFFCFNNLIVFSVFAAVFSWIAELASGTSYEQSRPFNDITVGLCNVSPYWISWMLQRNLGAAVDLSQLWTLLVSSFSRRFLSPTPRRLIELSAPQPFDYASYYNYFLFYSTVAICFAVIQPLILVVTALYFSLDSFMKKYLLLYVFITKYESGGMFWRSIFNRMLFLTLLGNIVTAAVIYGVQTSFLIESTWPMLAAMVPLPLLILGFKMYCRKAFDDEIHYFQKGNSVADNEFSAGMGGEDGKKKRKGDKMAVRFGHPVLYKKLITPMVHSKSQHLLKNIYTGRTTDDADTATIAGYSDVYMDNMDSRKPGKAAQSGPQGWEIVDENNMDFEHYKNRPEFRDEAGGDGELYGHAADMVRPGTPSSTMTGLTRRAGTWESDMSYSNNHSRNTSGSQDPYSRDRSQSADSDRTRVGEGGVDYPRGYHQTPSNLREQSPAGFSRHGNPARQESRERLVNYAAPVGQNTPGDLGGYGPVRYGNVPGQTPDYNSGEEDTSYDYFRRGRMAGR